MSYENYNTLRINYDTIQRQILQRKRDIDEYRKIPSYGYRVLSTQDEIRNLETQLNNIRAKIIGVIPKGNTWTDPLTSVQYIGTFTETEHRVTKQVSTGENNYPDKGKVNRKKWRR